MINIPGFSKSARKTIFSLRLLALCALLVPALSVAHPGLAGASATGTSVTDASATGISVTDASATGTSVTAAAGAAVTDDFNRADGSLGANWSDLNDGGLAISSQAVTGTAGTGVSGDIRTAESYSSDQYSQIEVTPTQLSGGQWIGPAVRAQNGGQDTYAGIYFWNSGNPVLMLYKRNSGNWTQLGSTYNSGPLTAGTQLKLIATGTTISLLEDGVQRITATDASITGGSPGIVAYGTGQADNWAGADISGTYTIGGAVTGLTGTVVLQDNGGDDLSVSSNGPFTFATPVPDTDNYAVTVKTVPAGQSCTVTSDSGTVAAANVTNVAVSCTSTSAAAATDDFNRADGSLGANWADLNDGGLAISSQAVTGTAGTGVSGDIRTAESYSDGQYSQIEVTSTQLSGGQWIGPAVRAQNSGQDTYAGIYFWNSGNPVLMLYKRSGGSWTQLGSTYNSGPLAAGTELKLIATGSTISLLEDGVQRITATDASITGGSPGIVAYGTGQADNWAGGNVSGAYTIGGTVTGLAGTVVLQDNGGDNLSVSSNGPFTFATPVPDTEDYAVTVKTAPAGQTCTVTGDSGTVAAANVTDVAVACSTSSAAAATDDFNRADGSLGASWSDMNDGGLVIASQAAVGTAGAGVSGDIRTAESYSDGQYSQVEVTSTQLSGGQWIGPAVRAQNGGQDAYAGIYFWNSGNPVLTLYKRNSGNWTQLGSTYNSGPLAAGTQLKLIATGTTISLLEDGVPRITATDTSITGGAPGIVAYGAAQADNWAGGDVPGAYTIGGTVTGLAGTVVLQDNGGDNLSVSSNGPFTFATPVPDTVGYTVTVQASPAGQTCTAASGSGTVAGANVTSVVISCNSNSGATDAASDNFNRADGSLGADWSDISDGGLAISGQAAAGTAGAGTTGDVRTESYSSNQYSQIEVTSAQLTGSQWIGAVVRAGNGGQDAYVGLYTWNSGSPELMLFKRNSGTWTQLGSYSSGPLTAGTKLKLIAVGATIVLQENGVQRITAGDASITGGAPGLMAYGTGQADNWAGGTAGFEVDYQGTDANGIASYNVISADDSGGAQILRVLKPTSPAAGVAHNFLFVLPVEAGLGSTFGDGIDTLRALDAQDQDNLTIIEPSFPVSPWYADNPVNANIQYESFMTSELVPWVQKHLSTTGNEQNWLIGFSKSGLGAQDLLLRHPGVFSLAASWDFPADMSAYDQFGDSAAVYGTDANFQAGYRLSTGFVDAHKGPFLSSNRIWIGSYSAFQTDMSDYDALLTSEGIAHTTEPPQSMAHRWDSGWVPLALAALEQDSTHLPAAP
jgi:hypothetical protein